MESLISVDSSSPLMQLCWAGLGQTELHHRAGGPFTSAACLGAPGTLAPLFCVIGNCQDLVEANSRLQGSFINCLRHTVCSTPIRSVRLWPELFLLGCVCARRPAGSKGERVKSLALAEQEAGMQKSPFSVINKEPQKLPEMDSEGKGEGTADCIS